MTQAGIAQGAQTMQQDAFNPYQAPDTAIEAAAMPPLPG